MSAVYSNQILFLSPSTKDNCPFDKGYRLQWQQKKPQALRINLNKKMHRILMGGSIKLY